MAYAQRAHHGSLYSPPAVTREEYKSALSAIHVAKRTVSGMPGQTWQTLLWSQSVGITKGTKAAVTSQKTGKGPSGILIGDATRLSKSNMQLIGNIRDDS